MAAVRDGDYVFVGTASATPRSLVHALESIKGAPIDVELVHFLTDGAVPHDAEGRPTTRYRHRASIIRAVTAIRSTGLSSRALFCVECNESAPCSVSLTCPLPIRA